MGNRSNAFIAADSNRVALPEGDYSISVVGIHDGGLYQEIEHDTVLTSTPVLSPDGSTVAAGTRSGQIAVWSVDSGELLHSFVDRREVRAVAFSPDGQHLVSGGQSGRAIIWHLSTGAAVRTLTDLGPNVDVVAFSPDGRLLATGGQDKIVRIWNTETGALQRAYPAATGVVTGLAFSPDGSRLACGTFDEIAHVRLLDIRRGTELWHGVRHAMGVTTIAFAPDGRSIASGSQDMTVVLWEAETGRVIRTLEETSHDGASVAFAPDGSFLVAITRVFDDFIAPEGDETQWGAVVWDTTSWTAELQFGAEFSHEDEDDLGDEA